MSDSGLSISNVSDDVSDDQSDLKPTVLKVEQAKVKTNRLKKSTPSHISKSTINLSIGGDSPVNKNLNNMDLSNPIVNRSESLRSLADSSTRSSSPVTVHEVRSLSNNFQSLLSQATNEIKRLTRTKTNLEKEQEKLLTVNVELALEVKQLLESQKEWKSEKVGLLAANEEFATEVERLYKEEELCELEIIKTKEESSMISSQLQVELDKLKKNWIDERQRFIDEEEKLVESIKVLTAEKERLIEQRNNEKQITSNSTLGLKEGFERKINQLEAKIASMQSQLDSEQQLREEGEQHLETLTTELEKVEQRMDNLKVEHKEATKRVKLEFDKKVSQLEKRSEKLAAENFEYAMENEQLNTNLSKSKENCKKYEKEISNLKVENQWLITNKKSSYTRENSVEDMAEQIVKLKQDLRDEKDKVKNLSEWKNQLVDKNKILKEENERLLKKGENLEHLMNDEVTDINEMLKVIGNIQGGRDVREIQKMKKHL